FLAGVRVQEYREVLPDRAEAGLQQLIRRGADHYPVALMPGHAQQLVTDGAADQIGPEVCFHGAKLRSCPQGVQWRTESAGLSDWRNVHVEARQSLLEFARPGWHVYFLAQCLTIHALQVDIKAPESVQVPEHALGGLAQRFALMTLVTQGQ